MSLADFNTATDAGPRAPGLVQGLVDDVIALLRAAAHGVLAFGTALRDDDRLASTGPLGDSAPTPRAGDYLHNIGMEVDF
ncbi:MAG: hypothetical protein H6895_07590 [Defluviimonas sp.]|uniref:hypothetical protein n=1 Tax=Albidovulum sp. TaxID=1872424 RepID=UPI001E0150C7|nr:hypothetical protein [Paracoccaceae bacterium]MCC0063934.1 hypothetical protein [Defluviimonas sp.]